MTQKFNKAQALRTVGVSYIGSTSQSVKLELSEKAGCLTYGIYLAPATLARDSRHKNINTCPCSSMCAASCLNGSGHNKVAKMAAHGGLSNIDMARIKRTHLFYDDREAFMEIVIREIKAAQKKANKKGLKFAVRLNCTSDLSPEIFKLNSKNILEIFPDVQFYDYTKVAARLPLVKKYANYDLTFSYDGTNNDVCEKFLADGGKVAVVFDLYKDNKQVLPESFWNYQVIDATKYDMRFMDPAGIMGLKYHRVANDYKNGKYSPVETPFVIREN